MKFDEIAVVNELNELCYLLLVFTHTT